MADIKFFNAGRKFILAMSTIILISGLWFLMKWGEHTYVQALSVVVTGYLASQAVVDYKYKPENQ